jgi:tetratricopeptide (TPR) repeat protein
MTPITVEQANQYAGEHLGAGRWMEAQDLYRKVLAVEPNNAAALHGMGMVSVQIGRLDMAIQWLDRAVAANPSAAEYHRELGEALRRSGLRAPAVGALERALQLNPSDAAARRMLDAAAAEQRRLAAAPLPEAADGRRYVVVTGYYNAGGEEAEKFFRLWYDNTLRYAQPARIFVINAASKSVDYGDCQWINLSENLFHHVLNLPPRQQLGGFSASVMIACLLAYHERADLLFKEQDCLAFGSYVQRLYDEMGGHGMVAGPMLATGPGAGLLSVSLMLIRHEYLLEFVARYLSLWPSDREFLPEHKLMEIAKTGRIVQSRMGYDRNRPVNYEDAGFHMQKITDEEMADLRKRGLI